MYDADELRFGRFELRRRQRMLFVNGVPVEVGSRAVDVLLALIDAGGAPLGKDELMSRVWPGMVVEENNITVQIHALRTALGADRDLIRTVARRGYCFTGRVTALGAAAPPGTGTIESAPRGNPRTNVPAAVDGLIGRDAELPELIRLQASCRLLTLTGSGGIGKTRLALELARQLLPQFPDGVWLVELAPLADAGLVPAAIATTLGLQLGADAQLPERVAAALAGKNMLLVLDNCEHVISAAACAAEALAQGAGGVRILATSREPLRVGGESVYRVPPLAVSDASVTDAEEILRHGAARLFVTRAGSADVRFVAGDVQVIAIGSICRRLDGIPLAIELAAARAASLGVEELSARLDDRLALLTGGRRTALPRHQTLRATLDWSYDLLPDAERATLSRLAVFAGSFSLAAATAVVADSATTAADAAECIANLVAKSLVVTEGRIARPRFRLLETTRAYAMAKLAGSGELQATARRHAAYYRDLFAQAETEWETATAAEWAADYGRYVDDVRAALSWAFSPAGDASIGVALAAASAQLCLELSLLAECRDWTAKALEAIDADDRGTRREMILECAFGTSLMFTKSFSNTVRVALQRANELARELHDFDYRLRSLAGLASCCHRLEEFREALAIGRRAEAVARDSGDTFAVSTADWIVASSLLFLGEYREALHYAERTRRQTSAPEVRRAHIVRLGRDGFISASCTRALILWAQGLVDQSAQAARDAVAEARKRDHPLSLCIALAFSGCIVPLWLGDLETAGQSVVLLKDHAERHDLSGYYAYGIGFQGQLSAQQGDVVGAERLLRSCLESLRQRQSDNYPAFLLSLAEVVAKTDRLDEGLAAAEEALRRIERTHQLLWLPEALRIKGVVLLMTDNPDTTAAEDHFHRSIDLARRQGALSWELRSATSFARLRRGQGRRCEARELLASVYDRFTEGFETVDLRAAKQILGELI